MPAVLLQGRVWTPLGTAVPRAHPPWGSRVCRPLWPAPLCPAAPELAPRGGVTGGLRGGLLTTPLPPSLPPSAAALHCLDDTWCGPGEKCCKGGRAPPHAAPCAPRCADDRSCPAGRKCCFSGCGLECVRPVAERPLLNFLSHSASSWAT
uniref:WAP domain-containing protein n=1 Tax=Varanus komodoensis TaxID=61221 RepID=A0A8D2KYZ8_VARKO